MIARIIPAVQTKILQIFTRLKMEAKTHYYLQVPAPVEDACPNEMKNDDQARHYAR